MAALEQGNFVTPPALGDVLGAQTIYQTRAARRMRLHVVTNAHFDIACGVQARHQGITLVDTTQLRAMIDEAKTTLGDIAATNALTRFVCPIQYTRSVACDSTAGFHHRP